MKQSKKYLFGFNLAVIIAVFVLNFFYQKNGFDFTLKCICSGLFAALGLVNLSFALFQKLPCRGYFAAMASGLVLAFLGDVLIGYDFIVGAATFALGHVCFVIAYCLVEKIRRTDLLLGGVLFLGCALFLTLCPLLTFDPPFFRIVCLAYALIISAMLGKAIGNLRKNQNAMTATVAIASALFFFSDLMLVLSWFIGKWDWTDSACMGTYYPALCLLALSMVLKKDKTK